MIMTLVLLVLAMISSYIVMISSVNPKIDIRRVNIDINKIPYIDSIRQNKNNIVDIVTETSSRYIPKNYEVLSNFDVSVDINGSNATSSNIDIKTEAIPFGLEVLLGVTSSLLLDSFLPLEVMFTAESIFLAYVTFIRGVWIDRPKRLEKDKSDRSWGEIWQSSLDSVDDPRLWFESWFLYDAKFDDIKKEDAQDFLSWAMFQNVPSSLDSVEKLEVDESIKQIEHFTSHRFPPRNDNKPLISMRSSLEKFKGYHKPLAFYLITQGIFGKVMEKDLKANGFVQDVSIKPFRYFIKKPLTATIGTTDHLCKPVVLFHGVGGLPAYIKLCKAIIEKIAPSHPFILVEMPYVSLHVSPTVPSVEEHVSFIKAVLKSHNYDDAIFIGHSWGSNVVSWISQLHPSVVAAAIFLDPVCFLLQLNNITKNWFYKAKEADQTLIKSVMGLVKTELFSVNTLQRNLVWFRNIIWPHELQERNIRTCIIVSSDDHIVPSKEVLASINQHNSENPSSDLIEIHELASADHGGLVFDDKFREETAMIIKNVIQKL